MFPLHLVYASFFNGISGGILSPDFARRAGDVSVHAMTILFVTYGLSYACMGSVLSVLFSHSARSVGGLTRQDAISARVQAVMWAFFAAIGLLSTLIALTALWTASGWPIALAGFSYALLSFTGILMRRFSRWIDARTAR